MRATRITYVGELGWELYVPAEFAAGVFDLLVEAGRPLGLAHAGYYAINALRLEKGYRAFGPELNPDVGPVQAGLLFAAKLRTDIDFLGRTAVERARAEGVRRRIVSFTVTDPEPMLWGGELLLRDGVGSGQVSSAAYATITGACVGLAFVWMPDGATVPDDFLGSGRWQVNASGRLVDVEVSLTAPYDPKGLRIRS